MQLLDLKELERSEMKLICSLMKWEKMSQAYSLKRRLNLKTNNKILTSLRLKKINLMRATELKNFTMEFSQLIFTFCGFPLSIQYIKCFLHVLQKGKGLFS